MKSDRDTLTEKARQVGLHGGRLFRLLRKEHSDSLPAVCALIAQQSFWEGVTVTLRRLNTDFSAKSAGLRKMRGKYTLGDDGYGLDITDSVGEIITDAYDRED
jgi:hypothetical protein